MTTTPQPSQTPDATPDATPDTRPDVTPDVSPEPVSVVRSTEPTEPTEPIEPIEPIEPQRADLSGADFDETLAIDTSASHEAPDDTTTELDEREVAAFQNLVVERQRARFGGAKIGAAFFGWLSAMGMAALLTSILAVAGAAFGVVLTPGRDVVLTDEVVLAGGTAGWIALSTMLVVLLVSYAAGGYVAGRMARFDGLVQGVAVWVWAIVLGIIAGLVSVVLEGSLGLLDALAGLPRIPMNNGDLTIAGIIAAVAIIIVTLGGALLGGWLGTRYHRRIDRAGLDA